MAAANGSQQQGTVRTVAGAWDAGTGDGRAITYTNPVHPDYFADPFVLRTDTGYVAYGTGAFVEGRAFAILTSPDLVTWTPAGGALEVITDDAGKDYWAPEVIEVDGVWWMYYSVGHGDKGHSLRVARADSPLGPFRDAGVDLTPDERFAIDPSPFRDEDGTVYLFYARDELDAERAGTMLAVDILEDMTHLRGEPRSVLRASADWQLYEADREMYGGVYQWHTLEGPAVVRRDGRYYCFYSGGSWLQPTYAVSYAVAAHPLGPWHEPVGVPRLLQTVPGTVIGPGHNSVTTTPDGTDVIVYHAWDPAQTARRMFLDPIRWTPDGPVVDGPSYEPRTLG